MLRIHNLSGFKRYIAAFVLGALMTLSMPPVGFFPILLMCVPGFILLSSGAEKKIASFGLGWSFGAGYFIFGLYWISAALFVDIAQWGWVVPLSLIAGPALFALYYGLIPIACHAWRQKPATHALFFVCAWSLVEWLRGHLLTGFPWNLPGYTWYRALPVMQISAYVGIYGTTYLTLIWAALPAITRTKKCILAAIISLIIAFAAGWIRMEFNPPRFNDTVAIRILQPNLSQEQKWNRDEEWHNIEGYIDLATRRPLPYKGTPIYIWPETALRADLSQFNDIADYITRKLPKNSVNLVGALRTVEKEDHTYAFYNSLSVLVSPGRILADYNKHHLVPFGEYIPFRSSLNVTPLGSAISGIGDFSPGAGAQTLDITGIPSFSPLICYEVIFPSAVVYNVIVPAVINTGNRPQWMVNVTNDGWYGKTAGPYQHFEIARVRAIEEGLPLVRAANTGISAVIDPIGRIVASLPLAEAGIVDAQLPLPLAPTFYSRFGDLIFFIFLIFSSFFAVRSPKKYQRTL